MQFLGRSSLRVRKLPGVNSSLLVKFMEEEGGLGLGKRVKRFATVADFFFQFTNDSFVIKYSSLFASSVRAGEHLVPNDSHTVSFLRFTDSGRTSCPFLN